MPPFQESDRMGENLKPWLAADIPHGFPGFQFRGFPPATQSTHPPTHRPTDRFEDHCCG